MGATSQLDTAIGSDDGIRLLDEGREPDVNGWLLRTQRRPSWAWNLVLVVLVVAVIVAFGIAMPVLGMALLVGLGVVSWVRWGWTPPAERRRGHHRA